MSNAFKNFKLTNTSSGDLFSQAGWIMINNYVQQEMVKEENREWYENSTFSEVLERALAPEQNKRVGMAEWLGGGLQSRILEFDSRSQLHFVALGDRGLLEPGFKPQAHKALDNDA